MNKSRISLFVSGSPRRRALSSCRKMSHRITLDQLPFQDKILKNVISYSQPYNCYNIYYFSRSTGSNSSTSNSNQTVAGDSLISKNIQEFKEQVTTGIKVTSNGYSNHIEPSGSCKPWSCAIIIIIFIIYFKN